MVTVNIADLPIDLPDSYCPLNPLPHAANSRTEVLHLPAECLHRSLTCPPSQQVTIWKLSDEVLLNVFRYYLDASPRFWPRLVHTCREWRRIVFTFQRALHLRLFCTHGTPVLKILDCWPALPIVVQYYSGSPTPEDQGNIIAALKRSGRVSSISLIVTRSLLAKFHTIKKQFSELEELVLLSLHNTQLTLPIAFRWGPRLRRLHLTGIVFPGPALRWRLSSSRNLVDVQLHDISIDRYPSPKVLVNALSGVARLQSLSLHFLSSPRRNYVGFPPPSGERVNFPSLIRLDFRGITEYLEGLLARIDAPHLREIEITFLRVHELTFDVSALREFIDRIEMHKSHRRAHILSSERAISISLIQQGAPTSLKLQLFCEQLSGQLSLMARICIHFSAFLFNVEDLRIDATQPPGESLSIGRWRGLVKSFTGVKWFHLDGNHSTNIVHDLQLPDRRRETVLPALHKLCIQEPEPHYTPLREAIESFMGSCRLSGCFIGVEYGSVWINEQRGTGITYAQCQDHTLTCF